MRTYSHAALSWAVARLAAPHEVGVAAWGAAGAVLPDLPAVAGAVWLFARRRRLDRGQFNDEVCAKGSFAGTDAALHSAILVGPFLVSFWTYTSRGPKRYKLLLALLVGWTGHIVADVLTHAQDARPILWPLSERRLQSPVSYWDRSRHARSFTVVEHAMLLLLASRAISHRVRTSRSSGAGSPDTRGEGQAAERWRWNYS